MVIMVTIGGDRLADRLVAGLSQPKKRKETTYAEKTLPTSIKEKETHWLRRAVSPLQHKAKKKVLMGVWRVTGSTRLHNLAAT
eukprot:1145204-Pelagomonas_calceolata.AAC.4